MKTTVYLADLRHNFGGVMSIDTMPLSVGFMKAVMDREFTDSEVESRIFAYPDVLLDAIKTDPPDVLMVSNYLWNEELSHFFLQKIKQQNPNALTVMGGPNIYCEAERQIQYFAEHPQLDIYVTGEGDFLAAEIVRFFREADHSVQSLGHRSIPSAIYRRDGAIIRNETSMRRRNIDEIPSPYLSGILDDFFDGKLAPFIETNRGCPFKCTYCVQGTDFYNKVNHFDVERMRSEIKYIGQRLHTNCPEMGTLRIADPNFGMYDRDVEISEAIGCAQRDFGWPTFIDATTGKNKPERIIECVEKVNGALVLYQAVQSLDEVVLRNINRSNIKLDAYEKMVIHVKGRGLRSNSDLILGLPGETVTSHLKGLHDLIDAGTDQAHCFQAMMLRGSNLETVAMREKYKFMTRFRVVAKSYGVYDNEKIFDVEEIIVGTDTLSFGDYLTCRKHHLAFSIYWNDSWFFDVVQFINKLGLKSSEWLTEMLNAMDRADGNIKALLDEFVKETVNELFPSREAVTEFYNDEENFRLLCQGKIGDNLLYKYRARASFLMWDEVCRCSMDATLQLLKNRGLTADISGFDEFWADLSRYIKAKHADGNSFEILAASVSSELNYNIHQWVLDGHPADFGRYRLSSPATFVFKLSDEASREMESAFKVWSGELVGLTKLIVRIRVSSQIRECAELPTAQPAQARQVEPSASANPLTS